MSLIALAPKMAHLMWFNKGIIILFVGAVQMFSMLRKVTIHCNMCLKCEAVYLMASGVGNHALWIQETKWTPSVFLIALSLTGTHEDHDIDDNEEEAAEEDNQ